MSSKYIKIQSQQNGNFTSTNNRVDFRIPASMGNVSFKDSFIQLYVKTSSNLDAVIPVNLAWDADNTVKFNNVALVKDAHFTSSNKGLVERVRRVDVLKDNMLDITRNTTQVMSQSYIDASQFLPPNGDCKLSIFSQFNKEGTEKINNADNVPVEIRVGDILDSWNVDGVVPMDKMGDSTLHLELNIDKLTTENALLDKFGTYLDDKNRNLIANGAVNNSGGNVDTNTMTTQTKYLNLEAVPYYVGMPVVWNYTLNGNPGKVLTVITSMEFNSETGEVTIEVKDPVTVPNGQQLTAQTLTVRTELTDGGDAIATDFTVYLAELVVKQENTTSPLSTLVYNQYNTYELNGNNINNYNYTLEIEGDASAVLIMIPNASGIRSNLTTLTGWRLYLNDQNLTDREESPLSALSTERLYRTFDRLGQPVRNVNRMNYLNNSPILCDETNLQTVICSPLFYTGGRKNLQMVINSAGLNNYIVYTACPRKLNL